VVDVVDVPVWIGGRVLFLDETLLEEALPPTRGTGALDALRAGAVDGPAWAMAVVVAVAVVLVVAGKSVEYDMGDRVSLLK
jgi:hypothetical protein